MVYLCYHTQLHVIAKQRNEVKRAQYRHLVAGFNKHQFLFIDESAKDDRTFQVSVDFLLM